MQIKENGVDNVEEGVLHGNQWLIHLSKEGKTKEKSSTNFIAEHQIILLFHVGSGENNLSYYQSANAHLMSALAMQLIENPAHQNIVKIFNNLGVALMGQGEFSKAQECYLNTLDTLHTIFGKESNHPNIAGVLSNLGAIYQNKGDFVVAHDYYRQALDMQHIIFGQAENHPDIANTLNNLGAVCLHQNDVLSAKNYLHAALEMLHILFGKHANHQGIALALRNLGMLQLRQNNLSAARDYCQNALNMQRTIMGQKANHSDIAETLNGLGSACLGMNNFSLAKDYFKQALTMQRAILGKDTNHPSIALTLANLGLIGQTSEDFSAARDYYQQALTMQYALFGQEANHPVIASILYQLGRISKDQNDFSAALTYFQQVLAMQYVLFGQDAHHPDISDTLHKLGEVCLSQNNLSQAQYYWLKRLRILFGQKAMDPEEALRLLGQLSTISIRQGNTLDIHLMTITPLIELLLDSDINVRRNAAAALGTLAMDPEIQTSIAKTEGIARFVDLLSDADMEVRAYAARALTNLAKNNIDIMSDVGVLPLMRSLDNHDVEVLKFLLIMLVHQTSNNEYPIITIQTKDIESLTVLLSNDDSEIRAYAALIIGTLAYNTENQMVIARAGVIPPLVHLLSDNNVIARCNATRALMYLVNNNIENRAHIAQAGGINPLVSLLDDNDVKVRKNAVWVLWNLAMNAENRVLMTQAEALVPLMHLLSDHDVDVRKNTIAALKYLVLSTENHLIIAQTEGIVSMIRFLAEGDLSVQKNVVWILTQLAINPENKIAITQAGGVRSLVALLSDKDEDLQLRSASLLASLACSKEAILTKEELIRNNVISIYVTFLENMKANIRLAGITGILALASYHRASQQAIMQVPQIIQKLIGFLNETDSNIIATSAGALSNIAGWKTSPVNRQGQNAIRENGAIPILVHLLNHEDNCVVENVCEALMTLSIDNIQNQIAMTDSNILPMLEQLLITNHSSTFKEDAGKMIGYCKKISEQRQFVYQEDQQHLALSQAQEASKLGRASYNNGDYDKACEYIMRALTIYSVVYGQNVDHNRIADTLYSLGKVHRKLEDDFSALNYYTQALKMMRALQKKELNYNIAETLYELGKLYKQQNKGDLAKEHFQQALDIYVSFPENICESEIIQLRNELSNFISITKTPQALYSARSGSDTNGERQETLNEKKCLVM